jgi:hypothetical protein
VRVPRHLSCWSSHTDLEMGRNHLPNARYTELVARSIILPSSTSSILTSYWCTRVWWSRSLWTTSRSAGWKSSGTLPL